MKTSRFLIIACIVSMASNLFLLGQLLNERRRPPGPFFPQWAGAALASTQEPAAGVAFAFDDCPACLRVLPLLDVNLLQIDPPVPAAGVVFGASQAEADQLAERFGLSFPLRAAPADKPERLQTPLIWVSNGGKVVWWEHVGPTQQEQEALAVLMVQRILEQRGQGL